MGVQVVLEVGEHPFDFVVRVGHPLTSVRLVGEKVRQVEVDAVHGRAEPLVRVPRLAGFEMRAPEKRVVPFFLPGLVVALKGGLACAGKRVHQPLERTGGLKSRILSEVAPGYLLHVELAHLDPVAGKQAEQSLLPIDNQPLYRVAPFLDAADGSLVVGVRLAADELQVQDFAGCIVQGKHNPPVMPPIRRIQMDEASAGQRRLLPFYRHVADTALDRGFADSQQFRKLLEGLLVLLIQLPQLMVVRHPAVAELIAAVGAFVRLDSFPFPVPDRVRRPANRTFAFVHTNLFFEVLKLP